jgi:hypothetical protein
MVAPLLVDTEELVVDRGDSREIAVSPTNFFRPQKGKMPMLPVFTTPGGSRKASDPTLLIIIVVVQMVKLISCTIDMKPQRCYMSASFTCTLVMGVSASIRARACVDVLCIPSLMPIPLRLERWVILILKI